MESTTTAARNRQGPPPAAALMHPPPNPVKRREDDSTKSLLHLRHGLRLQKGKGDAGDHNITAVGRPGQGDSGPRLQGSGVPRHGLQHLFFPVAPLLRRRPRRAAICAAATANYCYVFL
ncbi:hypothetical protein ACQJBY_026345 [Aegilops geniculata]